MTVTLPLSPQVFALLSELIEERTGLHYEADARQALADRVSARAVERGFDSLLDYYYLLRYDAEADAEFDALVASLVVNETYFFREADALRVLVDSVIAPAVARGERPRVWSAACSTGEEPLTLAMLLEQEALLGSTEIVASDISPRALERAAAGRYGKRSLRALPPGVLGRWLQRDGDTFIAARRLTESIQWRRINLLDRSAVSALGQFDVVVCRNVLIYFRDAVIHRVIDGLIRSLRLGGFLAVGSSESLLRLGVPLVCEERGGVFMYRKVDA